MNEKMKKKVNTHCKASNKPTNKQKNTTTNPLPIK